MKFSFSELLEILCEKIVMTSVNFGNKKPFINGQFSQDGSDVFTFFQHEDAIIVVSYDQPNRTFSFSVLEDGVENKLHTQATVSFKKMQTLYGEVLYVFSHMISQYDITEFLIYATPDEPKLVKIYDAFSRNPHIVGRFGKLGFHYVAETKKEDGIKFEVHHFYKKKPSGLTKLKNKYRS